MDLNSFYRDWLHQRRPDLTSYRAGPDVPAEATYARVHRDKASHRGIRSKRNLRELEAGAANQAFLDEIACLDGLEYLELGWPVTAVDLAPLSALQKLRVLKIDSPRAICDFTPIVGLPNLQKLFITNAKHLTDLNWLHPLKDKLIALGVEGGMWTTQTIESLAPLTGFALEALFLTNTRLLDQDLSPIATMPHIRFLGTGINAPRREFFGLRDAKPELTCQWFDERAWGDFKDPKPAPKDLRR